MAKKQDTPVQEAPTEPKYPEFIVPEMMAIADLVPYENNPRNITDKAINAVAASIEKYGMKQYPVIDENNVVVVGHTRLKAMIKLGYTHVPCIKAGDLTPDQIDEYRIIDNKSNEHATWNFELLQGELAKMDLESEIIRLNYTPLQLETIMQADWNSKPQEGDDEDDDKHTSKTKHTVPLTKAQYSDVMKQIAFAKESDPDLTDGEALQRICIEWRKLQP